MLHNLFRLVCVFIILGYVALFVWLNKHHTTIFFWPQHPGVAVDSWIIILASLGVGLFIGAGLFWFQLLYYKSQMRRLKKQLSATSQAIHHSEYK